MNEIIARLEAKISPEPNTGCWLWTAACNQYGYGVFGVSKGGKPKNYLVHRYLYQYYVTKIPIELDLDHKCRMRCCVNPEHLEPVTRKENLLRGVGLTAFYAQRTTCKWEHPYTPENTRPIVKNGKTVGRECVCCRRARNNAYYHRSKGTL